MYNSAELMELGTLSRGSAEAFALSGITVRAEGRFERGGGTAPIRPANTALSRRSFMAMAAAADLTAILWAAIGAQVCYNYLAYGWFALRPASLRLCLFVALAFVVSNLARRNYALADYLVLTGHAQKTSAFWNVAFLLAAFLGFLDRAGSGASRGGFIAFYFLGLIALYASRASMVRIVRDSARERGWLASRVMIVGASSEIARLTRSGALEEAGKHVVRTCVLRDNDSSTRDLAAATREARRYAVDEILIAAPLGRTDIIESCVAAFLQVPAAISLHLAPGSGLERFAGARVDPLGADSALRLPGHSISSADLMLKRVCDIAISLVALIMLLPVMAIVALAIKLDSAGPVLFLQTRHGYNKRPFRILKFRSMTALENGRRVQQATSGDLRVTRMGRLMRRFNIDELPQLVNVLRGEMSLVGPRPHAIVHDREFAREIALYPRRHNVKPGITGWAQVNGLRGPTDSLDKIRRRLRCDLHYVDNWSLPLDLWILVLTLFSRAAYRNAF